MQKINKVTFLKYKKQLQELYKLGKQHDKEKDPEKKAALEQEVIQRCAELKGKLGLQNCSEEEANKLLGVSINSSDGADKETGTDNVVTSDEK